MTLNVYQKGDSVRISTVFRNAAGDLADPTTARCRVTTPLGVTTTYVWNTDVQLVRDSVGMFHLDLVASIATSVGYRYKYQFEGTGNSVEMVERGEFDVEPSAFA